MPKEIRLVGGNVAVQEIAGMATLIWSDASGQEAFTIALTDESAARLRRELAPPRKPAKPAANRATRRAAGRRK